jgi:lambda repressor-like predicted transcriptional regulator/predicted XRE-type DNA-binding protein
MLELSDYQLDVIQGCLLGDACIPVTKETQNNRWSIKQATRKIDYLQHLHDILQSFSCGVKSTKPVRMPKKIHNKIVNNPPDEIWDGRFAYSSLLYTHHHLLFKKLRIQWYEEPFVKKSPKKIPDIFNLNWRLISYWYADDGNNNKAKKTITLSTQSFKIKYIEMLQEKLKYLNVESNIKKNHGYIITIGTKSYEYFIEQIKPYLSSIKCMQYKLDTVNAGKQDLTNFQPKSLTKDEIDFIISSRNNEIYSYKKIAETLQTSVSTVNRVIMSHKEEIKLPRTRVLNKDKIFQIVKLWNDHWSQAKIAKEMNVQQSLISLVVKRKIWIEITQDLEIRTSEKKNKLSPLLAKQIRDSHKNGSTLNELANKHSVSTNCIYNIVHGLTYKDVKKDTATVSVVYNPNY